MAQRYGHIGQNAQRQAMALLDWTGEDAPPASHEANAESQSVGAVH
jgi:hypothetical protein